MIKENNSTEKLKELNSFFSTIELLLRVKRYQLKDEKAQIVKKRRFSEIEDLEGIKKILNDQTPIIQSGQVDKDLIELFENKISDLSETAKQSKTPAQKNKLFDQIELVEKVIEFIEKERKSSSDEWAQKMITSYEKKNQPESTPISTPKSTTAEDASKAEQIKEKMLIDEINETALSLVYSSLPAEYSTKGNSGFQSITHSPEYYFDVQSRNIMEYMSDNNINESILIKAVEKNQYKDVVVKQAKKGILGMGAKTAVTKTEKTGTVHKQYSELKPEFQGSDKAYELSYLVSGDQQIIYSDYSSRGGQYMQIKFVLPEHLLEKIQQKIKSDPTFIRRLAKEQLKKQFTDASFDVDFDKAWEDGDENTNNIGLCPPYSEIDDANKKMLICNSENEFLQLLY